MERKTLGFGLTGSFCTWAQVVPMMELLAKDYDILPILSPISCVSENRFGKAEEWIAKIEEICKRPIIRSIEQAEPIGPKNLLDAMVVAPCTGNTLGKLAAGVTDTNVTMASKSNLRNANPLILAVSTNDALGASARSIATLMNAKHVYFVPMSQDDPHHKPASMVAHFDCLPATIEAALAGKQVQPLYLVK